LAFDHKFPKKLQFIDSQRLIKEPFSILLSGISYPRAGVGCLPVVRVIAVSSRDFPAERFTARIGLLGPQINAFGAIRRVRAVAVNHPVNACVNRLAQFSQAQSSQIAGLRQLAASF
jgi:hypothetical protein